MFSNSGLRKPLFENISVKFGGGNRYGLIGANGSGKSTFMKILGLPPPNLTEMFSNSGLLPNCMVTLLVTNTAIS